jgi:hypothetical protein
LVKDFIAKNGVTALEHTSYSPDLASADFYLFPQLKSALKGQNFCDATDVIKNATEELKRLLQISFQERFQHLCRCLPEVYSCREDYLKEMWLR